jgi:hypothetical protein
MYIHVGLIVLDLIWPGPIATVTGLIVLTTKVRKSVWWHLPLRPRLWGPYHRKAAKEKWQPRQAVMGPRTSR